MPPRAGKSGRVQPQDWRGSASSGCLVLTPHSQQEAQDGQLDCHGLCWWHGDTGDSRGSAASTARPGAGEGGGPGRNRLFFLPLWFFDVTSGPISRLRCLPGSRQAREERGEKLVGFSPRQIPGYALLWGREAVNVPREIWGSPSPPRAAEELMPILASPKTL